MRMQLAVMLVAGFVSGATTVQGQVANKEATAVEIVERMMEHNAQRQDMLRQYVSDRTYQLEYSGPGGDHHAYMVVHAEYTAPGRKRLTIVAESGSKVLCREVLRKLVHAEEETAAKRDWQQAIFSPESYNLKLAGREEIEGVDAWVIHVDPNELSKVSYRGRIWVSMDDYAIVRVLAEPAKSPSWMLSNASFDARYMKRDGVWVPETNVSRTHVWIGGDATVSIDYGSYPVLITGSFENSSRQADVLADGKASSRSFR